MYFYFLLYSIWLKSWGLTHSGLGTFRQQLEWFNCLVDRCLEGEMFFMFLSPKLMFHRLISMKFSIFYSRFADVFGARAALSLSCCASVMYFLLLASADSTILLFLHKLPAMFMHALPGNTYCSVRIIQIVCFVAVLWIFVHSRLCSGTQMIVADLSPSEKRADALAKLGLCFGIGMITGSSLGGTLSTRYGYFISNMLHI